MKAIIKRFTNSSINVGSKNDVFNCTGSIYGKSTKVRIPRKMNGRSPAVFDIFYTDVCSPLPLKSCWQFAVVCFIYRWSFEVLLLVRNKEEDQCPCSISYMGFNVWETAQRKSEGFAIQQYRWVRGKWDESFYTESSHCKKAASSRKPLKEKVAEGPNRTLMKLFRAMLYQKHIAKRFSAEALNVAVYVWNRVTTSSLSPRPTSCEVPFGKTRPVIPVYLGLSNGTTLNVTDVNELVSRHKMPPWLYMLEDLEDTNCGTLQKCVFLSLSVRLKAFHVAYQECDTKRACLRWHRRKRASVFWIPCKWQKQYCQQ